MAEFDLNRFVKAQEQDYSIALWEIQCGRKRSHWMWYIFPQITGLGLSSTSQYYAISCIEEAKAYLSHPVLGSHLVEICNALLKLESNDAYEIMGSPDDLKLHSSMTLFALATNDTLVFRQVLKKFFRGKLDERTVTILGRMK